MRNVLISSETGSVWRIILGHPQLIEFLGVCVLSLAHRSELRGSDIYLHIVKNSSGNFSLNLARERALGLLLLGIFSVFSDFFRGFCRANHLQGIYSSSGLKYFL